MRRIFIGLVGLAVVALALLAAPKADAFDVHVGRSVAGLDINLGRTFVSGARFTPGVHFVSGFRDFGPSFHFASFAPAAFSANSCATAVLAAPSLQYYQPTQAFVPSFVPAYSAPVAPAFVPSVAPAVETTTTTTTTTTSAASASVLTAAVDPGLPGTVYPATSALFGVREILAPADDFGVYARTFTNGYNLFGVNARGFDLNGRFVGLSFRPHNAVDLARAAREAELAAERTQRSIDRLNLENDRRDIRDLRENNYSELKLTANGHPVGARFVSPSIAIQVRRGLDVPDDPT